MAQSGCLNDDFGYICGYFLFFDLKWESKVKNICFDITIIYSLKSKKIKKKPRETVTQRISCIHVQK